MEENIRVLSVMENVKEKVSFTMQMETSMKGCSVITVPMVMAYTSTEMGQGTEELG